MATTLHSLEPGDRCYLVPERHAGGALLEEMIVVRLGRSYIYVKPMTASKYTLERAYLIANGAPKVACGRVERLIANQDEWLEETAATRALADLRRALPFKPAPGVTLADVRAAAALLKVSLP